mgnify:FL=1
MKKPLYTATVSHYANILTALRNEIIGQISSALEWLGGKVCLDYYHTEGNVERYSFYKTDNDGYGVELYVDTVDISYSDEIKIHLSNSEGCYHTEWDLSDLTTTDAIKLLTELENVIEDVQNNNTEIVTEYD